MSSLILFSLMLVLLLLSVPIAFAIGLSSLVVFIFFTDYPLQTMAQKLFEPVDSFPLLAVPLFILAGTLMGKGGIAKRLVNLASAFVGHFTGGYAIVTIVASMFFGAISGSSAATVASIGAILIPAMINKGYSTRFAASTQAVSGELGVIIPPSIPMIIFAVVTSTSVGSLFISGILPGVLLSLMLSLFVYFICKKNGWEGEKKSTWSERWKVLRESFFAIVTPLIILGGIYSGIFTPTEAAAVAVFYALFVGFFVYKELKLKDMLEILGESVMTTATVLIIVASAGLFSWLLTINKVPQTVADLLVSFAGNEITFLLIVNVLLLFIGMFFETAVAIIIMAPILLPIALTYGIDPIHFGIIMIINLAIGMVTPPLAVNLFISSKIAGISLESIAKGVVPFLLLLVVYLLIITFIPQISLLLVW